MVRRRFLLLLLLLLRGIGSDGLGLRKGNVRVCVVSLRILNGERSFGSGGGMDCEGVIARAVERQRMQGLWWRDCRSRWLQRLDCRTVGAVEVMVGDVCNVNGETVVAAN